MKSISYTLYRCLTEFPFLTCDGLKLFRIKAGGPNESSPGWRTDLETTQFAAGYGIFFPLNPSKLSSEIRPVASGTNSRVDQ